MSAPPRILFVAEPSAAVDALQAARAGGALSGQLAPTAEALRLALAESGAFDAVVFVPGGPVEEVEVAVFVPDDLPLFVVADEVPLLLTETAAVALPLAALATLADRLTAAPAAAAPPADEAPEPRPAEPDSAETVRAPIPVAEAPHAEAAPHADPAPEAETVPDAETAPDAAPHADADAETVAPAIAEPAVDEAVGAMPAPLASLADHLPVGLYRSTPDGRILYANSALAILLGAPSVEALADVDVRTDLGYPRDAFTSEIRETGAVRNLVVSWVRPGGERVHTRENARSILDADGRVVAYEGTMEDVTAEVEAQIEERATARQHRAVAAFTAAAALAGDAATLRRAAVSALVEATGASWALLAVREQGIPAVAATAGTFPADLAEVYGAAAAFADLPMTSVAASSPAELGAPPDTAAVLGALGIGALASVPVLTAGEPDGVLVWGRPQGAAPPAEIRGGEAIAWHLGGHLARAAALEDLRDSEASLAAIAAHTPHVLYRLRYTDAGPVYDYLSPAVERLTGYSREEVEARGGLGALVLRRDVIDGDGLASGPVDGADQYRALYRMATADGERWVENAARPWCDATGHAVGLVGVLQDVSDRQRRESELADAAQAALDRQRALVDLAHLDGADAFGASAAAIAAATLGATDVSFWACEGGASHPLYAPSPVEAAEPASFEGALEHVARHRALTVSDAATDDRIGPLGLEPFVRAYGVRALLVAPIRRHGQVEGLVVVHRDQAHDWDPAETEFAAAVADAVALAMERAERERVVAELVDAREAAEVGREAAERMNRLKSSFLANMSHEFRTPLTGILGFADLLAEEVPEQHRPYVGLIERNGRRLLDTLNSVLDLSRLEAGEYPAALRPLALAPAVREATREIAAEAEAKGLRFDLELDDEVAAELDPDALARIIGHVAGNAVKFTDAGGVLITVERANEAAVLRVADTGLGISPSFVDQVSGAFHQEDSGHARSHEGAGLGLTVADRMVALLGGTITIESQRPGGTVVTIAFPRVDAPEPAQPAPPPASAPGDGQMGGYPPDPADPADPGDLLGEPFDFTFLSAPALSAVAETPEPSSIDSPAPPPTDMFDFRFGRSSDPPSPEPVAPPQATTPPQADPAPTYAPPSATPAPPTAAPAPPPPSAPPSVADPVMIVRNPDAAPAPTIPPAAAPPVEDAEVVSESDPRPTILVVEDNDDTRMLLERILRSTYRVTAVGDARSALLAMNAQRFSGLVLDINLGGKETGADVLRIARTLPDYGSVFAIALTAYALPGDRERLLESGFNAYVSKPFTRQVLMETLADGIEA
ncbi:ATP-binding protein [Rubrivirga sp. IMCC45206]|uniref:PAS domain-containing hybrid sensor histidine kinase/response regulator n=1 Tax=Rubrivirga sp. IMCC45206 TaxID=3391614 RepID=UPI00398FA67F